MLGAASISTVLDVYRPERASLLELLGGLSESEWQRTTECPRYDVRGIAAHLLGDDLSLLSRQRDGAVHALVYLAAGMRGLDFRTMLGAFNDRWVATTQFMSTALLIDLLRWTREWTAEYYGAVDPDTPGEAVALFGAEQGATSPLWQAIAREYLERWIHHSQIRRALSLPSVAEPRFLAPGVEVTSAITHMEAMSRQGRTRPGGLDRWYSVTPTGPQAFSREDTPWRKCEPWSEDQSRPWSDWL